MREELKRTVSAWGSRTQADFARLKVGVVGLGSVGAIIAEGLARQGVGQVRLIDFDRVELHNLDRLLHAERADVGRLKVEVAADALRRHATAPDFNVEALPLSIVNEDGFQAALDCDVLFSCVDRPWPRAVMNMIAHAHLIPVIDGGIRAAAKPSGSMRAADWKAHVAGPGHRCLQCLGQYDPAHVELERLGKLDDPTYIAGLAADHILRRAENVFTFSLGAASLQLGQLISMVAKPSGIANPGAQTYHAVSGTIDLDNRECDPGCPYPNFEAMGDHVGFAVVRAISAPIEGLEHKSAQNQGSIANALLDWGRRWIIRMWARKAS